MLVRNHPVILLAALCMAVFVTAGCDNPGTEGGNQASANGHDHDHHGDEHVHDHPPHGPNHGHIFDLDSEEYQGEWCKFKGTNVIRMHILDAKGEKNVPVKVDSFVVKPKVGEGDVSFELEPEDADENGLTATYKLDDQELTIAIPLGVDIIVKSGDQTWKGEIKAHEPLDH